MGLVDWDSWVLRFSLARFGVSNVFFVAYCSKGLRLIVRPFVCMTFTSKPGLEAEKKRHDWRGSVIMAACMSSFQYCKISGVLRNDSR